MRLSLFLIGFCVVFTLRISSQQLVINEVSQGPSGAKEYVELLVIGTPTCNSIPCMDLRNYIIDDNNGYHASGSGTGIASGCVKFQNIAFWSCIPIGTMILIYNDADPNALVPATDLSMTDGNCKLVIPISNCTLLEKHTSQPSTGTSVYPTTGFSTCGSWGPISMANGDDSFQTINPSGGLEHSVSWGNNSVSPIIYFSAAAGGQVAMMTNATNNNPFTQSNWSQVPVAGNETPGSPNNAANAAWIASMNNNCTPLLPLTSATSVSNAGCTCNGSATVTASGAIAPYTYTWFPSGGNASVAAGLCSGTYTVNITSSNGCVISQTVSISSSSTMTAQVNTVSVSCNGLSNGSASVTIIGGTAPYSYTWSPVGGNNALAINLAAGTYTALISDNNNCTVTALATITQPVTSISANMSFTNASCGNLNGAASVSVSGGTPGYAYTWFPSGGNGSIASGLGSGNYTVSISDVNNCQFTKTVSISQTSSLSFTLANSPVSCFGGSNGSASVSVSGGTSPYSYTWNPAPGSGQGTQVVSGLSSQSYSVIVNDAAGCSLQGSSFISQPLSGLTATAVSTGVSCFGLSNGTASVSVSGGSPAYSYTWFPTGSNGNSVLNASAGSYTVLIADANNCTLTAVSAISQPSQLTAVPSATNVLCFGMNNGAANVTAGGGSGGYTYVWSPSGGTGSLATNLSPGTYTVTVKDFNNCTVSTFTTISQPTAALTTTVSATNISCNGLTNGSATVSCNGGTSGYTVLWLPGANTTLVNGNLSAGTYTAIVSDINNCISVSSITIQQPPAITLSVNQLTLCSGQSGVLSASVNGGSNPYSYSWNGVTTSSSITVNSSFGNTYLLTVTDANGCSAPVYNGSINTLSPLTLSVSPSQTICAGTIGNFTAQAFGGNGSYQYTWLPAGTNGTNISGIINNPVTYTVTVSDGCSLPSVSGIINVSTETIATPSILVNNYFGCTPLCVSFTNAALTNSTGIQTSLWNFGDGTQANGIQPFYCFNQAGIFSVVNSFTTAGGCVGTTTLNGSIIVNQSPVADFYPNVSSVNYLEPNIIFINQSLGATSYYWNFGGLGYSTDVNANYNFDEPGKYMITLIANNGLCSDTAFRFVECLPEFTFYAPDSFTPNHDNINDIFLPKGLGWDENHYMLMIFDRWGERIFSGADCRQGWDGTNKGEIVKDDTYIWKVKLKDVFGKFHTFSGHVVVLK